jgi:probable F420-dependent oxidoreductase
MKIGVVFPQTEIGPDVGAVRAYGEAVDQLGFAHVLAYDHVLGADTTVHHGWRGPYDSHTEFHEPFVLFAYLAGCTSLEFVTGIIILPQRQTALVAKQAAALDLLSAGRLRVGVGVGWNRVEYEALGEDFTRRGARLEEQAGLLRELWTKESVTFEGKFDRIIGAGLAPLPVQRPIPLWFGGSSTAAYGRMGRLADGWFPQVAPGADLTAALEVIATGASSVGRDPSTIGMEGRLSWHGDRDAFLEGAQRWRAAGASHLSINTMGAGLATLDDHLEVLAFAGESLLNH